MVKGLPGIQLADAGDVIDVGPAQARWIAAAVRVPPEAANNAGSGAHPIEFEIERLGHGSDAQAVRTVEKSTFVVPR
jgi:hypothetical protein